MTAQRSESIVFTAPVVGAIGIDSSWERFWQTIAMFSCSLSFILPMVFICWIQTGFLLLSLSTRLPVLCYLGYAFVLDRGPTNGSRRPWLRSFTSWWSHSCDYLPLLLVKTAELDPKGKYVLGYHPHGIISVGCFGSFATNGARTLSLVEKNRTDRTQDQQNENGSMKRGFSSLFPGVDRRVITLPQNFSTPFLREYFLSMGAVTSDKTTFRKVLKNPGRAVIVVVGGAAESLMSHEGAIDLVLQTRVGFVREALMANASLVPVIAFGETDLYHTPAQTSENNSWLSRFQDFVKKHAGLGVPVFSGRNVYLRNVGFMPKRKPVVVVVGAPIAPPLQLASSTTEQQTKFQPEIDRATQKALNKDGELVIEWHAKYIQALKALYAKYKDENWNLPGKQRMRSMKIVR